MHYRRTSLVFLATFGLVAACGGSSGGSGFDDGADTKADGGSGATSSLGFGDDGGTGTGSDDDASVDDLGDGGACAGQSAVATRAPAYLYFLFDKSGSMGDGTHGDPKLKLNPVSAAFTGFVQSTTSKGISATMTLFPNTTADACATTSYTTPAVALSALPDSAASFVSKLPTVAQLGTASQGTPTLPALKGVLPAAKANAQAKTDGKTVVIMITDGEPVGCSGNGIDNIKTYVSSFKDSVPTYVIGVGTNSANLSAIATAGGTTALTIDVGDPATQQQLITQIDKIRLSALSCDLAIPAPPTGQTLDLAKINVAYTPSKGSKLALPYDVDCKNGGWHFDDATNATKIVLCDTACNTMKSDPNAVVGVEFGCARRDTGTGIK